MRTRAILAVATAVLLLAGCGDDDDGASTTTTSAVTTVPVSTTAAVTTTGPPTTAGPAATTTTAPAASAIVLRPDGLGLVPFGASKDATMAALNAVLGPLDESGTGCELGGPGATTARWDELRVEFAGEVFGGYVVRPLNGAVPTLGLQTEAGIGLGSTVAHLQAAYGSRLQIPGLPADVFGGDDFGVSFPGTERKVFGSLSATTETGTVTGFFTQVCE